MSRVIGFAVALALICVVASQFGGKAFVVLACTWWLVPLGIFWVGYMRDRGRKWVGRPPGVQE